MQETKRATAAHWSVLLVSAALESVWAIALDASEGFTVLVPAIVFCVAAPLSLAGLGFALRGIPISIGYVVWTGLGAALTALASFALGIESLSALKLLFIAGIVACIVGLKLVSDPKASPQTPG